MGSIALVKGDALEACDGAILDTKDVVLLRTVLSDAQWRWWATARPGRVRPCRWRLQAFVFS